MRPNEQVETLRWVIENDFTVPEGISPFEFALIIRPNLRSPDPELRDTLTYSILCELLMRHHLSEHEIAELLELSVADLKYGLGEVGTDSVFARSFAVLMVAAVIIFDAKHPNLSIAAVQNATGAVIEYAYREQDHRGYVEGKGWAHSVAHTADALGACAAHPKVSHDVQFTILEAIRHLACVASPQFCEEDDRLAYPVLRMVLADDDCSIDWGEWLMRFDTHREPSVDNTLKLVNTGHFLRGLYLLLLWEYPSFPFMSELEQKVKQLHGLYHYRALPLSGS